MTPYRTRKIEDALCPFRATTWRWTLRVTCCPPEQKPNVGGTILHSSMFEFQLLSYTIRTYLSKIRGENSAIAARELFHVVPCSRVPLSNTSNIHDISFRVILFRGNKHRMTHRRSAPVSTNSFRQQKQQQTPHWGCLNTPPRDVFMHIVFALHAISLILLRLLLRDWALTRCTNSTAYCRYILLSTGEKMPQQLFYRP